MLLVGDLFSGIGGFTLGLEMVGGFETKFFVEIDPFCQKVLRKNFPGVPIYGDIKEIQWIVAESESRKAFTAESRGLHPESCSENPDASNPSRNLPEGRDGEQEWPIRERIRICLKSPIDVLTGGFPCQPFSCAGKRAGTEDDRYLWPEMLRAIREVKPRWIVAENVPGLLTLQDGVVFEGVCTDLETEGYEVIPLVIPTCAQGAPHRRDRVWIIAKNSNIHGSRIREKEKQTGFRNEWDVGTGNGSRIFGEKNLHISGAKGKRKWNQVQTDGSDGREECGANIESGGASKIGYEERKGSQYADGGIGDLGQIDKTNFHAPDTEFKGLQKLQEGQFRKRIFNVERNPWQEHWYEAATRLCRVDDGVPKRVDRLKSLGNAVVPQIICQIGKAILKIEGENK